MKRIGRIYIWTGLTDHRLRVFRNRYAVGIRFHRFCFSFIFR